MYNPFKRKDEKMKRTVFFYISAACFILAIINCVLFFHAYYKGLPIPIYQQIMIPLLLFFGYIAGILNNEEED